MGAHDLFWGSRRRPSHLRRTRWGNFEAVVQHSMKQYYSRALASKERRCKREAFKKGEAVLENLKPIRIAREQCFCKERGSLRGVGNLCSAYDFLSLTFKAVFFCF